jgi:hypothetical protein
MEAKLQDLAPFGLTAAQVSAYSYLLLREAATAPEVASGAGIPRNRAYEILDSLAALGLVQTLSGNKRHFKALPIGPYLTRQIQERESELAKLRERAPQVERDLQPAVESLGFLGDFATWRGRTHVTSAAARILREASVSLHIFASPVVTHRWLTPFFGDVLEQRHGEGLDVRLIVTLCSSPDFDPLLAVPYRLVTGGGALAKIVADRRVVLIRTSDGGKDDAAYEIRNEGMADESIAFFEHFWTCDEVGGNGARPAPRNVAPRPSAPPSSAPRSSAPHPVPTEKPG